MTDKVSTVSSGITYAASGTVGFFGAWTANELALLGGFLLGFATFAVNFYYKRKQIVLDEYYRQELLKLQRELIESKKQN